MNTYINLIIIINRYIPIAIDYGGYVNPTFALAWLKVILFVKISALRSFIIELIKVSLSLYECM